MDQTPPQPKTRSEMAKNVEEEIASCFFLENVRRVREEVRKRKNDFMDLLPLDSEDNYPASRLFLERIPNEGRTGYNFVLWNGCDTAEAYKAAEKQSYGAFIQFFLTLPRMNEKGETLPAASASDVDVVLQKALECPSAVWMFLGSRIATCRDIYVVYLSKEEIIAYKAKWVTEIDHGLQLRPVHLMSPDSEDFCVLTSLEFSGRYESAPEKNSCAECEA